MRRLVPTATPRIVAVLDVAGAVVDHVAADPCPNCRGRGGDGCGARCEGGWRLVTYAVEAPCELMPGGHEGETCRCGGDGWQADSFFPHELLAHEGIGTAAQRAEAAALVALCEAVEDEAEMAAAVAAWEAAAGDCKWCAAEASDDKPDAPVAAE